MGKRGGKADVTETTAPVNEGATGEGGAETPAPAPKPSLESLFATHEALEAELAANEAAAAEINGRLSASAKEIQEHFGSGPFVTSSGKQYSGSHRGDYFYMRSPKASKVIRVGG